MMMYRLLIVDDEPDVADGLYDVFKNTERLELDIYKAYSAFEAMDIMDRVRIDILMTDIYMPGMTGLQLVAKVKSQWPYCRVIFLTGYNEFDYIYSAIKFEGAAYLLKTESFEKILESVENAARQIDSSIKLSDLEARANKYMNSLIPYMQKEYVGSLLAEEETTAEQRRKQFAELKIPLDPEKPVLLLVGRLGNPYRSMSLLERTKLLFTIRELAEEQFSPALNTFYTAAESYMVLWMIQPMGQEYLKGKEEVEILWDNLPYIVKDCAEAIQSVCMESFKLSLSFIIDSETTSWEMLAARYDSLRLLLHGYTGLGHEILLLEREKAGVLRNSMFDFKKLRMLEDYLESGQREEFFSLISELSLQKEHAELKHYYPLLEIFYSVSAMFLSYINRYGLIEKVTGKIRLNKLTNVDDHPAWEDAVIYFRELAEVLFSLRISDEENGTAAAIQKIKQYIADHINEELSLAKLADKVYFNPSYLSRLFKQTTGTNLLAYINEARLDKAKELLRGGELKIHEIAAAVGYESASYFTQFFKRALKISPQEYRDKMI